MLNQQGRRVTRCFMTTPEGALMNEIGLGPAQALLNNRNRRYKLRQMTMTNATGGGRMLEIRTNVSQQMEGIDGLNIEDQPVERRSSERTTLSMCRNSFTGTVIIQDKEQMLKDTKLEREGLVLWTDGSRKEDEWVSCPIAWKEGGHLEN